MLASRPALRRPLQRIHDLEQRLDDTTARLHRAARARLTQTAERLASVASRLDTLSPLNVLQRGYSLTHTVGGRLIRDPGDVRPGDRLVTRVAGGEIVSQVTSSSGSPPGDDSSTGSDQRLP